MRVAIVHDWLGPMTGAERVLQEMLRCYPGADVFTAVDFLPAEHRAAVLGDARVIPSFIQRLPGARTRYWSYVPLMPLAMEQFDLTGYDLVLSNSHTVAKGVVVQPEQVHVCYLMSPPRFAWDLQPLYLRAHGMRGLKAVLARVMLARMRVWDAIAAARVDAFVACSRFVARRCEVCYRRDAAVLHPPVDVDFYTPDPRVPREDFHLAASRLTPFKRLDLAVEAFNGMPDRRLVVIGDGPERRRIERLAGPNVTLLGRVSDAVLRDHMRRARSFVFTAPEDFGIVMAEAQACGTPVVALGRGGAREIVRDLHEERPTGVLFAEQTAESLRDAIRRLEASAARISPAACRQNAERFAPERFRDALVRHVDAALARYGTVGD
ncbi:glycosyl transferase group 1 [Gemmatirosa kalamazoonensis]|uniref:Glycosyl transferase group 1 n=1 Tax=Gemmatirosa kalamazoonensis TaxID=861299 RepID=W0RM27_9BACT|nr:glycosyltransferase [Gemmatirosa kalamazoonensis]AHG90493.1 glycosyl transferase group 1 [Gemmatirosa kalamazoonensis]